MTKARCAELLAEVESFHASAMENGTPEDAQMWAEMVEAFEGYLRNLETQEYAAEYTEGGKAYAMLDPLVVIQRLRGEGPR